MPHRKTMRQVLLTNTLLVATLACVLTGSLWVGQEIFAFEADVASLRTRLYSARKERMQKEVDAAKALEAISNSSALLGNGREIVFS